MKDKVVGVVAEFNPFHNGHKYQINEISKQAPLIKIGVISGNFVQRGEVSIINKFEKAKIALEEDYDILVELPVYYSIQNADIFCEYSVKILNELGTNIQVFGIETDNFDEIYMIKDLQKEKEYNEKLRESIRRGNSYIKSHELVLNEYGFNDVYKSNNILALSYIKSIERNSFDISAYGLKRIGSGYNDMESNDNIASATMIRKHIDSDVSKFVPKSCLPYLTNRKIDVDKKIFDMFKYVFSVKTKIELMKIYDFNDSMYNRVEKCLKKSTNMEEFLSFYVSRNFSSARIKRVILNILLNIEKKDISLDKDVEYIRVLGINEKGAKYLKKLNNPKIFVNWKDIEKNIDTSLIKIEKNAFILHEIITGDKENLNVYYMR
ncbi:nucleotidyltransferase family protein [Streptobacillus moniliformis]|uniref:nucleotidyltransferase family protein n=1 Tax=Streptobacillus moniliformis TaxID=34105 RepID=UPI0007E360F0|nr:nucleotidyltransferase family protein [Streptobacillus moniliformis]